jgi:hypothetical protein
VWSINGQEVFELGHNQIVSMIKNAGTQLQIVIERQEPRQTYAHGSFVGLSSIPIPLAVHIGKRLPTTQQKGKDREN